MKRRLLAVFVLLGGAVGVAQADFLILVANLGRPGEPPPQRQATPAAGPKHVPGGPTGGPPAPAAASVQTFDVDSLPSMVMTVLDVEHAQPSKVNEAWLQQNKSAKVRHPWGTSLVVPA